MLGHQAANVISLASSSIMFPSAVLIFLGLCATLSITVPANRGIIPTQVTTLQHIDPRFHLSSQYGTILLPSRSVFMDAILGMTDLALRYLPNERLLVNQVFVNPAYPDVGILVELAESKSLQMRAKYVIWALNGMCIDMSERVGFRTVKRMDVGWEGESVARIAMFPKMVKGKDPSGVNAAGPASSPPNTQRIAIKVPFTGSLELILTLEYSGAALNEQKVLLTIQEAIIHCVNFQRRSSIDDFSILGPPGSTMGIVFMSLTPWFTYQHVLLILPHLASFMIKNDHFAEVDIQLDLNDLHLATGRLYLTPSR